MAVARVRTPKQVGRYQLLYELGTSYLGSLWAGRVEGSDALALLRLVSLSRLDADARVRLLEAAWQAMEVRDDRVLPVTDVVASDGELSVVSEYVEGLSLRAAQTLASVRRKPMSVPVALRFILDVVDGVIALHRAMTELGDEAVPLFGGISADSVMVTADGRASLLDVAIASAASGIDALGKTPERVAYAAPEQLGERAHADARTDVFSVGTLAWELLANRRLFVGSDKAVAQKVLAAKVPKLEDAARKGEFQVPPRLGAAVLRALSLEPGARFESLEAFRSELDAAGIAPAEPADVASYVVAIADGAFARTREALSLPPRPTPARALEDEKPTAPLEEAKKPEAMRPNVDRKPSAAVLATARPVVEAKAGPVRQVSHTKLAMPAGMARATAAVRPARPSVEAKPQAKPSIQMKAARPAVEQKPEARAVEPRPGPRAVEPRAVEPRAVEPRAVEPKPEPRAVEPRAVEPRAVEPRAVEPRIEAPQSVTTSKRVSIEPTSGDGWRALEAPASTQSTQPAKIRPRQQTIIGLPAPAGLTPEATPSAPVTEPPPSSSEEPTTQYSREHLKQLAARQRAPSPPNGVPEPEASVVPAAPSFNVAADRVPAVAAPEPAPSKLVSEPAPPLFDTKPPAAHVEQTVAAREVHLPRLVSLRPTARPLSEIHTERPPPPEPDPTPPMPRAATGFASAATDAATETASAPARANAGLPPAPAEIAPVRVAPAPPPPARVDANGGAAPERPAFSRPPPATVAASIYPSQVAPALIHDPRANRAASIAPPPVRRPVRGLVLGVVASVALIATSATIALVVMSHRGDTATREVSTTSARSEALTRTESSPAPAPSATEAARLEAAPTPSATEAARPEAAPTPSATEAARAGAAPTPSATETARPETTPSNTASTGKGAAENDPAHAPAASAESGGNAAAVNAAPTRAATPHAAPRAAAKPAKKHPRFVPSDI
jgi:serine/threonine-protein kinase